MLDKTFAFLQWAETVEGVNNASSGGLFKEALEEVKGLRGLPEIVMLTGSARFKQAFEDEAYRLALAGCIVLGKHVFKPGASWPLDENAKNLIHAIQFRLVDLSNRVHVVNVDSYIGDDTYNVIRYAIKQERAITFLDEHVTLKSSGAKVTSHHFLQATRQRVEFEQATVG